MKKILVVVDMQNDFIDGSLGTAEAENIVENVCKKINAFDGELILTMDTHSDDYLKTQEGKMLPVTHCIKNTHGWEIHQKIKSALSDKTYQIVEKPGFGSLDLPNIIKELAAGEKLEIELVGLCTDICVVSNALILKANLPEVKIFVESSCCAGVTKESHNAALLTMKSCQINVI